MSLTADSGSPNAGNKLGAIPSSLTFPKFHTHLINELISTDSSLSGGDGPGRPSEKETRRLFNHFDVDGDGMLNDEETTNFNEQLMAKVNQLKSALIVVDFQNDFVTGSLSVRNGPAGQDPMEAVAPLNTLLFRNRHFQQLVYTLDWHPSNHISFYEHARDADRSLTSADQDRQLKPFDTVRFTSPVDFDQVLYPTHCVQHSWGAELVPGLTRVDGAKQVLKGNPVFVDAYSGFVDNQGVHRSELEPMLRAEKIEALFIGGLCLDICVGATARDAAKRGFLTAVVVDCSKGLSHEQIASTDAELRRLNVAMVNSADVHAFLDSRRVPWRWLCHLAGINIESPELETSVSPNKGTDEIDSDTVTATGAPLVSRVLAEG